MSRLGSGIMIVLQRPSDQTVADLQRYGAAISDVGAATREADDHDLRRVP